MNKHRYQKTAESIEALIQNGELKPGDRIPAERTLALSFGVSRNCVREAIRVLAEKGILKSRLGDGTYVCSTDTDALKSALADAVNIQKNRIREIFELRMLLEPQIASLAAQRMLPRELDQLKAIVFDQGRAVAEGGDDGGYDSQFHKVLIKAAGNKVVREVMEQIDDLLSDTRSEFMRPRQRKGASVEGHLKIIRALENKDAQAAYEAMTDHIREMQRMATQSDRSEQPC